MSAGVTVWAYGSNSQVWGVKGLVLRNSQAKVRAATSLRSTHFFCRCIDNFIQKRAFLYTRTRYIGIPHSPEREWPETRIRSRWEESNEKREELQMRLEERRQARSFDTTERRSRAPGFGSSTQSPRREPVVRPHKIQNAVKKKAIE